jgi:hypothetical protein
MKRRLLLVTAGAVLIALIATGAVLAAAPGPEYLDVDSFSAVSQNHNAARLSVTTGDDIPRKPDAFINSKLVVGLAWADLDTGKVFATTIHPVLGRDSHQNPDSWHAHTATVTGGATPPNDFCVVSIDSTPTAGIQLRGNVMKVNVQEWKLPVAPEDFDAAAGFTLEPDDACASGLAVRLVANP